MRRVALTLCLWLWLAGCTEDAAKPPAPPPQVTATEVVQRTATVMGDAVGEVSAVREVGLRPQVTGTVRSIHFKPGQRVKEGDLLFVIDPRPYEASLAEAQAALADAQSTLASARQDVARYEPLLPSNAIPRATYDAAVAAQRSAEAAVEQRKAVIAKLKLDLANARVTSPVTGQIGQQQLEVGGLATAGQTVLATVSTLDPVFVTFSVPEADYVRFMRARAKEKQAAASSGASAQSPQPFRLILPDGKEYSHAGEFDFAEPAISTATGTLGLRARFPNPDNLLRPGMNVRVRFIYEVVENALLVPQKSVTELLGRQFVSVIGPDNKVEQRPVELGARLGELWIVRSGLQAGERVIVDGTQKAPPGAVVSPRLVEVPAEEKP